MARTRRKIGEILMSWGRLTEKQLNEALTLAKASGKRVGEALVELKHATDSEIAKALANQHNMEYIDLDAPNAVDRAHLKLIPTDIIKKYMVLPLGKHNGRIKVVVHDPMDLGLMDDLRFRLNTEVELALGAKSKIKGFIDQMLSETRASIDELTKQAASVDRGASVDQRSIDSLDLTMDVSMDRSIDVSKLTDGQAPVIRLVDKIIDEAVNSRASDIHIEPMENRVRLRFRIDGVCHERDRIPKRTQQAMIARIKIMSGMKIQERRLPQDGRIKKVIAGAQVDFRVSACPAYHGESVVLRILRPESARVGLRNLGMREDTLETFSRLIKRPNGIFLVTGPTGSGKTTSLYSALDVLNRPDRKIITAEDPVEYNFKGINQCQVNEQIGLTFSKILRAMLRQAPNIVLVGEIRDKEVGEVAVQAALTGHLVFSTLHTNDAPSALTRLIDMGIKPFLVASSVQAVLAQRLCRLLCEDCKEPDSEPNARLMRLCGITAKDLEGRTIYKAVGCPKCANTGYKGRKGIYELMIMNTELRDLAFARAPLNQLRAAALGTGMRNLLGDGKLRILDGNTTLDEISRITQVEGVVEDGTDDEQAA
jgi:type IV pilus assembly protein PilB